MVLFPSEASSLRLESAVLAGSGASAGRHTGVVDGRAGPLDLLNVSRDTIPSTRDFLERHPSTSGARNAEPALQRRYRIGGSTYRGATAQIARHTKGEPDGTEMARSTRGAPLAAQPR